MNNYPKGSEWQRWDLHIHTPASYFWKGGKKLGEMNAAEKSSEMKDFIKALNDSDVAAFCIMDYWTFDWCVELKKYLADNSDELKKTVFFGMELRVECPVDYRLNIHVLLSDSLTIQELNDFKSELKIRIGKRDKNLSDEALIELAKTFGEDKARVHGYNTPASLTDEELLELGSKTAEVTKDSLKKAFNHIPEESGYILLPYDTSDGLVKLDWSGHPQDDNFFMQTASIFETRDQKSIDLFQGKKTDDNKNFYKNFFITIGNQPKPCICGSDAHRYSDYGNYPSNKITWVKADPTFEGLKQIIYEPASGERVKISSVEPDQKDGYKIISTIRFENTPDFPEKIELNKNLCSIIGSRSSGKSALLAYIAHSIDPQLTEKMKAGGPGEGEDYKWEAIKKSGIEYSMEWRNGQSINDSPGKIVYIPQNYLFSQSKDSNAIKEKIEPVLFKILPEFEKNYNSTIKNIDLYNKQISEKTDAWFELADSIKIIAEKLKELGKKESIEIEKKVCEQKINQLKNIYKLSDEKLKEYKEISATLSQHAGRIEIIKTELSQLSMVSEQQLFFNEIKFALTPSLTNLPADLQGKINRFLAATEDETLKQINQQIIDYKSAIEKEKEQVEGKIVKIEQNNKALIEKYQKNVEIGGLVNKLNEYNEMIKKIEAVKKEKDKEQDKLNQCGESIKSAIENRITLISELSIDLKNIDQNFIKDIQFGLEYDLGETLETAAKKMNTKNNTKFVDRGKVKITKIREVPDKFLAAVYTGDQKIITGNEKRQVAKDILSLTEKILLNAEMEGDTIGGFSEPTMTPGKRALFFLRLLLKESEDTWPLLIDQPEDDLDSRSIYDDIVPFLKKKKKERQIIMVSHNANLVIGADSEQVIVANRHGTDRKNSDKRQFNYLTGSLEYSKLKDKESDDTLRAQGVCEHACEILDGGRTAFELRKKKYNIK
jgi:hypothetical protein